MSVVTGCSVQELWFHLHSSCSCDLLLDDSYKAYLWSQLLHVCTQRESAPITLFTLPTARPHPPPAPLDGKWFEADYVHPHTYCMVSEGGVRGSCAHYTEREDVTAYVLDNDFSLEQLQLRYTESPSPLPQG